MLPVNCGSHADYQGIKELHFTVPANAKRFYKQYFRTFILYTIGIPDVVSYSKKSRAYLFKKFRDELGTGISEYIMSCRLKEAKSLLKYTDKPLSEISSYLCFSSQSHFQNTFKKHFNITPLGYREQTFHRPDRNKLLHIYMFIIKACAIYIGLLVNCFL